MKPLLHWAKKTGPVHRASRPRKHSWKPELEALETRLAPVVGAFGPAPVAEPGLGLDGVVNIYFGDLSVGSGSLLQSGRHILTAAHVLDDDLDGMLDPGKYHIEFTTLGGTFRIDVPSANIVLHPDWTGDIYRSGRDIALITLPEIAPLDADRYALNFSGGEIGEELIVAGFGMIGTGDTGEMNDPANRRHYGHNIFDAYGHEVNGPFDTIAYDFDNRGETNALGNVNVWFPDEGFAAAGDSGGPVFIHFDFENGKMGHIAGVTSYRRTGGNDIDDIHNSTFGEIGFATRVSDYQGWISYQMGRDKYDLVVDMAHQPGGNDSRPDTIEARVKGAMVEVWVNGKLLHEADYNRLSGLRIYGTMDDETITLSGALHLPVLVNGRWGADDVTIDDSNTGNTAPDTIAITGQNVTLTKDWGAAGIKVTEVTIVPASLHHLTVKANRPARGGTTAFVQNTPQNSEGNTAVTLLTGGGNDNVFVERLSSPLSVIGQGGVDTVTVGFFNTLSTIRYSLGVSNDGGSTELNLMGGGESADHNIVMSYVYGWGNYITGLAPAPILYGYSGISAVNIHTGSGLDAFDIKYADANTRIWSGAGNDQVAIGSTNSDIGLFLDLGEGANQATVGGLGYGIDGVQGAVELRAQGGTNVLVVEDRDEQFARTFTLTKSSIQRDGSAAIRFADVYSLIVYGGQGQSTGLFTPVGNTFEILDTSPSYTTLFTGPGRDAVKVKGTTGALYVDFQTGDLEGLTVGGPQSGLDNIKGPMSLYHGGPGLTVTIDDSGTTLPREFILEDRSLRRSGAAAIDFGSSYGFPIFLQGGPAGNTINVLGKPGNLTVLAGAGNDTINIGRVAGTIADLGHFIINGQDGEDLVLLNDQGQAAAQTYNFFDYEGIPILTVPGSTFVFADMIGDAIVPSATEVLALLAGMGTDIINASWTPVIKLLVDAGGGDDQINGSAGRDLFFGGLGADVINAGDEEDVVLAGDNAFGADPAALAALMAEWGRTDLDYADRVDHLLNGGGLNGDYRLDHIGDDGLNSMSGGAGLDLIFGSQAVDAHDQEDGETFVDSASASEAAPVAQPALMDEASQAQLAELQILYGFRFEYSYFDNWGGWSERWFTDRDGVWFFVLPDGALYRWLGGQFAEDNELIAVIDVLVWEDPTLLFGA